MQITPLGGQETQTVMPGEWLALIPGKRASDCHSPGAGRTAALAEQEVVNRLDPVPACWGWGGGGVAGGGVEGRKESSAREAATLARAQADH